MGIMGIMGIIKVAWFVFVYLVWFIYLVINDMAWDDMRLSHDGYSVALMTR